ncbi:MAG: carboxymuconolactone decarboxylase family protein [Pseudomonadales bacterium]|jgi:alkylhydroperoxidase family enzyme
MANPLISVPWDRCLLEPRRDRELESYARRHMGIVPPGIAYLSSRPWLVRTLISLSPDFGLLAHLDVKLADLVGMAVSQANSCRYCYAATRWMMRIRGLSERRVDELERRHAAHEMDARTEAALEYARALSRAAPLPGTEAREKLLAAGFSPEEHRELVFVVGYTEFANRVNTLIAVPPRAIERASTGWRPSVMRAVSLPVLRRLYRKTPSVEIHAPESGPYAGLLQAFAGTSIGQRLQEVIADMSTATVLEPRRRALVFAVVAHALECEISAAEARAMLPPEVSVDEFAESLAHLGGAGVVPAEPDVARFVRDSIWYTPLAAQRQARALKERLPEAEFVDVIGLASLANALCRVAAGIARP